MKRIMSLMLGLSLVLGTVSVAFCQDTNPTPEKKTKKKKSKKKKGGDSGTTSPSN